MKIKPSRIGDITLSFTDIGKSCPVRNFFTSQMCLNAISENKILGKISEFTVCYLRINCWTESQRNLLSDLLTQAGYKSTFMFRFPTQGPRGGSEVVSDFLHMYYLGARWLSGRVLDSRRKGRGFEPHRCHCIVSLSKDINPSLVLVQPRIRSLYS